MKLPNGVILLIIPYINLFFIIARTLPIYDAISKKEIRSHFLKLSFSGMAFCLIVPLVYIRLQDDIVANTSTLFLFSLMTIIIILVGWQYESYHAKVTKGKNYLHAIMYLLKYLHGIPTLLKKDLGG